MLGRLPGGWWDHQYTHVCSYHSSSSTPVLTPSLSPQQTDSSASHSTPNKAILALPIVLSLVGVTLLVGGILTFLHIRNKKRRATGGASGEKRAWVNRKAGWAKMADEEVGVARPEVAQVAHREYIL
jgi:hypothetical protein